MAREMILVLDFGGQYNQLIARRVRENNVYCEVHTALGIEKIRELNPVGIIFPKAFTKKIRCCRP